MTFASCTARDVNFCAFYFSISELQFLGLVEYSNSRTQLQDAAVAAVQ